MDGMSPFDFAVGSLVILKTAFGEDIQGEIFAFDAATDSVVLAQTLAHTQLKRNYRILKASCVKTVEYLGKTEAAEWADLSELPPIDLKQVQKREENAIRKLKEEAARIGEGVTSEAQEIFNALNKTYPCRWDRDNIIVLDQVLIRPPYGENNCAGSDPKVLNRVKTVLANVSRQASRPAKTG
eukprot:TRINITY_DN814_c0_g1_i1.p1 TRINITY_DN814_c0_g1~~TRINITY_DN814_c0_g1_i1.p1  ORF type:complete len:183 (-),score=9.63 TRINITY_DN814_c0_g1_i1:245-793(-)